MREWERPAVLLLLRARRERRARRADGPGPRALRPVLRPDADPVPVPGRDLGPAGHARRGDHQAVHLHAGRLAADARGGGRDRRARRQQTGNDSDLRVLDLAAAAAARARRSGSSCASPPPSGSRCRPSRSTAGCPTAIATCRCRSWPSSRPCCPRSPPTASCASRCRCSRTPPCTSRT